MIVLDYSGTLSLGAVQFGRTESLIEALKRSGLWDLGVSSPEIFWDEIVNPTWQEGSTTGVTYKHLLAKRLRQIREISPSAPEASTASIEHSAANFVDRYFERSSIAPEWADVLHTLVALPEGVVVIATDHYAEATGHIAAQLRRFDLDGLPALQATGSPLDKVLIANSADFGCHKSSLEFWEKFREAAALDELSQIVIIDDFGFNEQTGDSYAGREKVTARMNDTIALLKDVFKAQIHVFPFFLHHNPAETSSEAHQEYQDLIRKAERFSLRFLAK